MTKEIPLTQGKVAIVCDCHAHLVENHKWCARWEPVSKAFYAVRMSSALFGKRKNIQMHRVINSTADGMQTDHINGETLDNRCCNLRSATVGQNMQNRGLDSNNTSGFKGVSWHRGKRKWQAKITVNGNAMQIGRFKTPEDAAHAYDDKAKELFGEFARLNFPES